MALCVVLVWKIHHHLWGSMNAKYKIGRMHWIKNKSVKLLVIRFFRPLLALRKSKNFSPSTCHRCWWPFLGGHRKYQKHKHSPLLQVLPKHWYWLIDFSIGDKDMQQYWNIAIGSQNITFVGNYCEKQLQYWLCSKIEFLTIPLQLLWWVRQRDCPLTGNCQNQ